MHRDTVAVLAVVGTLLLWGGAATAVHAPTTQSPADAVADGVVDASALQDNETQADSSVTFEDQNASDGAVTVQSVTVPDGGYVAVHDSGLSDGDAVGSVVGVSDYLEPGTHENVTVTLYDGVTGADFSNASAPNGTETLVAMPHEETGDNDTFAFVVTNGSEDGPYVTDDGPVVDDANVTFGAADEADSGVVVESLDAPAYAATNATVTVNATVRNTGDDNRTEDVAFRLEGGGLDVVVHQNASVEAGETANVSFDVNTTGVPEDEYIHGVTTYDSSEFTTITVTDDAQVAFDDQESNGSVVSVSELFVPEGGYVVVHDSSLLDGDALGSVVGVSEHLDAGYYEDVNVTLFEGVEGADFDDRELADNETLIAMPHLETNNNSAYDFVASDGEDDGPYVADGEAVVDAGNVTLVTDDEAGEGDDGDAGDGEDENGSDEPTTEPTTEEPTTTEDEPTTTEEEPGTTTEDGPTTTEDNQTTTDDGTNTTTDNGTDTTTDDGSDTTTDNGTDTTTDDGEATTDSGDETTDGSAATTTATGEATTEA